jgi:hypothetical protein
VIASVVAGCLVGGSLAAVLRAAERLDMEVTLAVVPRTASDYTETIQGKPIWFSFRNTQETGQVAIRCDCGKIATVGFYDSDHTIDERGNVSGPVQCPKRCGWIVFMQLEGWTFGPMPLVETKCATP